MQTASPNKFRYDMTQTDVVRLGISQSKRLYVSVVDEMWMLQKINLLAKEPHIRFIKVTGSRESLAKSREGIDWSPIRPTLGIVIHKAVIARIIKTMTLAEAKSFMFQVIAEYGGTSIKAQESFLSNEHGRLYLTVPGSGWGWRLGKRYDSNWYVERMLSKRISPVTEPHIHLSVFASMLTPISDFMDSILQDFGSFADPYSLHDLKRKQRVTAQYIDVPLARTEQVSLFTQPKPQEVGCNG